MMIQTKTVTAEPPSFKGFINPVTMVSSLLRAKSLIGQFAWRDVVGIYKGTYLGLVWQLITPLMTLGVYTLAFGVIMNAPSFGVGSSGGKMDFALNLFCGLIVYGVFSNTVIRAPSIILANRNYVKKVIFPLEILPVAVLGSSLVSAAMSLAILIPALLLLMPMSSTMYLFPVVLVPLCAMSLGLSWFLASLGVFLRDIGQAVNILIQLFFFLSPVIYPLAAVPAEFTFVFELNPLTYILEDARRTLILGQQPDWFWWMVVTAGSLVTMQLGYMWFMRSKRAFGDVV